MRSVLGCSSSSTYNFNYFRHRFFQRREEEIVNCQAGTIIDRDVVHPLDFDFFLQSHGGSRGTSRPAHYSVRLVVTYGTTKQFLEGGIRCAHNLNELKYVCASLSVFPQENNFGRALLARFHN
jgi:hypothetical protein